MKLNHHQWKLVYDAVRKQQVNSIVDGSTYKEYDAILNELWDLHTPKHMLTFKW